MKKTLAILISAILVVAAVCAFTLTSGAAAAPSVTVYVDGGAATELNATTTTVAHAGTGTFAFDAATGTLTLNNFNGNLRVLNNTGDLTVKLVGTNVIDTGAAGNIFVINNTAGGDATKITFTGAAATDTLKVKSTGDFLFNLSGKGEMVFKDKANVTIESVKDPIHFAGACVGGGLRMQNEASLYVNFTGTGTRVIGCNADANATLWMEGGTFKVDALSVGSWGCGLDVNNLEMTSGKIDINVKTTGQALVGLRVGASADGKPASGKALGNFKGGTIEIDAESTHTPTAVYDNGARVYGIFILRGDALNFDGTTVTINAKMNKHADANTAYWTGSGNLIGSQYSKAINVNAGTITLNGANSDGAFGMEQYTAGQGDLNLNGGTIKGTAQTLIKMWGTNNNVVDFDPEKVDISGFTWTERMVGLGTTRGEPAGSATFGNTMLAYKKFPLAAKVEIKSASGTVYTLNSKDTKLPAAALTDLGCAADAVSFEFYNTTYKAPVLTLNGTTEKFAQIKTGGACVILVKGANVVSDPAVNGGTVVTNQLELGSATLIKGATADASITVNGSSTGGYNVCVRRYFELNDAALTINSQNGDAFHLARSGYANPNEADPAEFVLSGKADMKINAYGSGMRNVGGNQIFTMKDDAKLTIKPIAKRGDADNIYLGNAFNLAMDRDDGTGNMFHLVTLSDNAQLKIEGKGVECTRLNVSRVDKDHPSYVATATKLTSTVEISDNAKFEVEGNGQAFYMAAGGAAKFTLKDNGVFKAIANDRPANHVEYQTGLYQSGLQINASSIDMDILGGTFYVEGMRNTWNYGALALNSANTDLLIKDANFTVKSTNNTKAEYTKKDATAPTKIDNNFINNAIIIPSGAAKITIAGKAVVDVSATNDTKQTNRAHALFLQGTQTLTIQDEAVATFTAGGTATANTGAGIHSKGCAIIVKDKATLNAAATGTASAAITFEGAASLTVEGEAKVNADGGKDAIGIRNYNGSASGAVTVKGGTVVATGKTAISATGKAVTLNAKSIEAGASAATAKSVTKIEYNEGYVRLGVVGSGNAGNAGGQGGSTTNPGTSDVNVALFAVVALATIAVAAAVVLRKKSI